MIVPANCTDYLQPLDLTVNKVAKSFLKQKFAEWYADQVASQFSSNPVPNPVDLSTARMKSIGVSWLIQLFEHLQNNPHHMVNGFIAAGIPQSIDAGKPVIPTATKDVDSDDSDNETDVDDDEEDVNDDGNEDI